MSVDLRIAIACLCLGVALPAHSAVINARSMARSDVESAVSSAREGDTVSVPAGKEVWTHTLQVNKAITLQFAGMGQSVIVDDIQTMNPRGGPKWSEAVLSFTTKRGKRYRLTGLEIDKGVQRKPIFINGAVQISGATDEFRIDHCGFNELLNSGVFVWDSACGVIDHCVFDMHGNPHGVSVSHQLWGGQEYGDGSWDTPVHWGTAEAVYMEDCLFKNTTKQAWAAVDSFSGARWVFRHNKVINANITAHGTESTGVYRGTRSCEVYLNDFSDDNNWGNTVHFRSASAVVWSNTAQGYRRFCVLHNYRNTDNYKIWGPANGKNGLDKNEPGPVLTVTHSGPAQSRSLVVAGANWRPNQWVGFSVTDLMNDQFGLIVSNTVDQAFLEGPEAHQPTVFNPGDKVQFYKIIAALDMPGMGLSGKLSRGLENRPAPPWPNQQIEPIYSWGNTLNGTNAGIFTQNAVMVEGVHYFNDTPKPGYKPLSYPHPLTQIP